MNIDKLFNNPTFLDSIMQIVDDSIDGYENDRKHEISLIVDTLKDFCKKIKANNEYQTALDFLVWFKWDELASEKLIKETRDTLIDTLRYELPEDPYMSERLIDAIANPQSKTSICDYYRPIFTTYADNTSMQLLEPSKHTYEDYVKAVVANPFKYSKETRYKVYKFLQDVLEKNKIITKYTY